VSWKPGRIDLFGVGTDQRMRHAYHQQGDPPGFTPWSDLGGSFG
jgi:hypothetical protein